MTMEHGRYLGGIRTIEDLRQRCRMEDGCWIWGMGTSHGRPSVVLMIDGKRKAMNGKRAAMLLVGKAPGYSTYAVARSCCPHPVLCVNPEHVKLSSCKAVRSRQNARPDLVAKWRLHGIKQRGRIAKLSPEAIREIREAKGSEKVEAVASKHGTSKSNVYLIWAGKTWRDVLDIPYNSVFGLAA